VSVAQVVSPPQLTKPDEQPPPPPLPDDVLTVAVVVVEVEVEEPVAVEVEVAVEGEVTADVEFAAPPSPPAEAPPPLAGPPSRFDVSRTRLQPLAKKNVASRRRVARCRKFMRPSLPWRLVGRRRAKAFLGWCRHDVVLGISIEVSDSQPALDQRRFLLNPLRQAVDHHELDLAVPGKEVVLHPLGPRVPASTAGGASPKPLRVASPGRAHPGIELGSPGAGQPRAAGSRSPDAGQPHAAGSRSPGAGNPLPLRHGCQVRGSPAPMGDGRRVRGRLGRAVEGRHSESGECEIDRCSGKMPGTQLIGQAS
jgi:hypothetical protein